MFKKIRNRKQEGFTIIEVMIVLAIAGLIMVVVLIAVPQLQRSQRNNARQSTINRISTEIGNFSGNNNGRIPVSAGDLSGLITRYLDGVDTLDPTTGNTMGPVIPGTAPTIDAIPTATLGTLNYATSRSCNGEQIATGSARNYALYTLLEGGAIYCIDNV